MPVRPQPMTYKCPNCGWKATTAPKSDVLEPGDYYSECPRCHFKELEVKRASMLEAAASQLPRPFGKYPWQ